VLAKHIHDSPINLMRITDSTMPCCAESATLNTGLLSRWMTICSSSEEIPSSKSVGYG